MQSRCEAGPPLKRRVMSPCLCEALSEGVDGAVSPSSSTKESSLPRTGQKCW